MSGSYARLAAIRDFQDARKRAMLQQLTSYLTGKSVDLLSYEEVAEKLKITGQAERGLREIPLEAIVGSVGRYADFTRTFLPRNDADQERWASVRAAASSRALPPIEVYQLGSVYFVLDGNHRVSIARQEGLKFIEAYVTEVRTRVPFSSQDKPDALIIKAEYAAFLEYTRLDRLRPDVDLLVSVPGQYVKLENHIEVHRYFAEVLGGRELSDQEAVCLWYDEAYLPMAAAIREQGILRYFPGRTETDFYVWLATHRAALQNELGWQIRPEVAVTQLVARSVPSLPSKRSVSTLYKNILHAISPKKKRQQSSQTAKWSQEKALARYSDRLFADILVLVDCPSGTSGPAFQQALIIAGREGAQICGLCVVDDESKKKSSAVLTLRETFEQCSREAGLAGTLAVEIGETIDKIRELSRLTDLVVLDSTFLGASGGANRLQAAGGHQWIRPLLIVPDQASSLQRIVLAYDDSPKSREALFVAAYIAEQWGSSLTVLTVLENGQATNEISQHAQRYLTMHEVEATFVAQSGPVATTIANVAVEHGADLLIIGGHSSNSQQEAPGSTIGQLLGEWKHPLLICP